MIEKAEELHDETQRIEREDWDAKMDLKLRSGQLRILSPEELAKITGQEIQSPPSTPKKEVMTDTDFLNKHVPGYIKKEDKE